MGVLAVHAFIVAHYSEREQWKVLIIPFTGLSRGAASDDAKTADRAAAIAAI